MIVRLLQRGEKKINQIILNRSTNGQMNEKL